MLAETGKNTRNAVELRFERKCYAFSDAIMEKG